MKRFITTLFAAFMLIVPFKAQAFNPFKYIHFGNYGSDECVENFYKAKTALNDLLSEYESKNLMRMMDCVSERFTTDKSIFEDNVREEFSQYAFIEMRHYVEKVIFDDKNEHVLITINYIKRVQDRSTADISVTNGTSDLIFKKEDDKYLLWKMQPNFLGKN